MVDEMQMLSDYISGYLNRTTGKITLIEHDDITRVTDGIDLDDYDGWQKEYYQNLDMILDSDDCLKLPSKYDIHEYRIMQNYCYSIEDEALRREFLDGISAKGAFRMFKNLVYRHGFEEDWFDFRDKAFKKIAIDWLEDYGLPYKDDM
jgi:hypothetical protein